MAGRLAADLRRRPGLRLQVEHGLDARHAGLLPAGPDPPPLPPPRADLLARLRLQRELHPAAQPRRGRPRQGLAATPRCRATAGRSSPTCARCTPTCGRTPARSCCSWAASSAQEREWSHERSLDWHLLENPEHAGIQSLVRDLNRVYRERPALWEIDDSDRGFYWLEPNDADNNVVAFCRVGRGPGARRRGRRVQPLAGAARGLPRSACRRPAAGSRRSTPTPTYYGGSNVGNLGGVEAEETGWGGQPFSAELTLPPLGVLWLVPERSSA